jgi:hypothetical protein
MQKTDQTDSVITNLNQITNLGSNDEHLTHRKTSASKKTARDSEQLASNTSNSENSLTASKRPKNTALKQQRLPAWQPILTAKTVLPLFFVIGVIFEVLGGVLLHYSDQVNEYVYDYTDCTNTAGVACKTLNTTCLCETRFTLSSDFEKPVYIYYGLQNFYQNHRRYVKSRDDNQLLGRKVSTVQTECAPYDIYNGSIVAPCGAIANSLFNDSLTLNFRGATGASAPVNVSVFKTGIAWTTDRNIKFQNPESWAGTVKPKNWPVSAQDLGTQADGNYGYQNEDLIVWMRTAALPTFRKLYRRVDHASNSQFSASLPKGDYSMNIVYNYPVSVFDGRKTFIISTTTWIGGKNPFLGIAYLVVGSICIILGFVFLYIVHDKFSHKTDNNSDSNNNKTTVATVESPEQF